MKHKKKILCMCLCFCLLLTSCIPTIQLNERALVQAIGIDLEGEEYALTFQIFSPMSEGGGNIGASSDNAKIIESKGKNVTQAIDNAALIQGKKMFVGQNRIIIIGEELAKKDVSSALNYFNTTVGSRKNADVLIAKGKASDIIKAKINQGMLPAEILEKMVKKTSESGAIEEVRLFELLRTLYNKHNSAFLPVIELKKKEEESQQGGEGQGGGEEKKQQGQKESVDEVSSISLANMCIITDNKLVAMLDNKLSRGIMWIRDSVKKTDLTVSAEKFDYAEILINKSNTKIIPQIEGGKIHFNLDISCVASLGEVKVKPNIDVQFQDIHQVQAAGIQEIERECNTAFQEVIQKYQADVFYFGDLVWHDNIDLWKKIKDNWGENIHKVTITVNATLDIDDVGVEFLTHA